MSEDWSRGDELGLRLLLVAGPLLALIGVGMEGGVASGVALVAGCGMFVTACLCKAALVWDKNRHIKESE